MRVATIVGTRPELIPAILYYVALFLEADLEAARKGLSGMDASKIPDTRQVLKAGWYFPLPFVVLIVALFFWNDLPEKAALRAVGIMVVCSFIFGYKGKRLTLKEVAAAIKDTGLGVLEIIMIGAAAGMVIGMLYISGFSFGLTMALVEMTSGSIIVLLVMAAVVCIILGMGMPTVGVYVLLATMVAPALIESGIQPIAAHLFILYFGMMSMITPPVAIGAFAAATLSGASPMKTGYAAMRFGWMAFVIPFMFVGSSTLLMEGPWPLILIDLVTALIGTYFVCAAVVGFLFRRLAFGRRLLFGAIGLATLAPHAIISHGAYLNMIGVTVGIILVSREWLLTRRHKTE